MQGAGVDDRDREAQGRLQLALVRAFRPLDDDEVAVVREQIARSLTFRQQLRSVTLENADAPDYAFDPNRSRVETAQAGAE